MDHTPYYHTIQNYKVSPKPATRTDIQIHHNYELITQCYNPHWCSRAQRANNVEIINAHMISFFPFRWKK